MFQKTIILTGGHAKTTAEAVIAEIKRRNLNWEIVWIGQEQIPGKIPTIFTSSTLLNFLKIPLGLFKSLFLIVKKRPDLTLSFGGSSGSMVSFACFLLGIPVVIHEQTASVGRGNKFVARFAKKIAISRASSGIYFPGKKSILTGNPINRNILALAKIKPRNQVKTILVTGGSSGSEKINQIVSKIIPRLRSKYRIIHQAGDKHAHKYRAFGTVDMPEALAKADIVIGRAGANTVSELIAAKKPSILIPLPFSYMNEQTKNAEFARHLGVARILPQSELTAERLEREIENLIKDYPKIIADIKNLVSPDLDASKKLVDLLEKEI